MREEFKQVPPPGGGKENLDIKEQINAVKHEGFATPTQAIKGKAFMEVVEETMLNLTDEDKLKFFEEYRTAIIVKRYVPMDEINEEMLKKVMKLNEQRENESQ